MTSKNQSLIKNLFLLFLLFFSTKTYCQSIYTTTASGDFHTSSNWVDNTPPPIFIPHDVTIFMLHNMTNNHDVNNNGLIISTNGSTFINNGNYSGIGSIAAEFINNGNLIPGIKYFSPSVITSPYSNLGCSAVTTGGTIINNGGLPVINRGVCYSTQPNPTINDYVINSGSGNGSYISDLINLQSYTIYYARAFATNNSGTSYGNEISFTTNECELPNAIAQCVSGQCTIQSCHMGYQDCNLDSNDGCETNLNSDNNNCNICGVVCTLQNASSSCINGQCVIISCNLGYSNCNNLADDGCEVDLNNDSNNCGVCGIDCGTGFHCENGQCVPNACPSGYADCNNNNSDGCEIDINNDANNCGTCGAVCSLPNAESICANGECIISFCHFGFDDCNGINSDGCETFVESDINNCGSCGIMCGPVANGVSGGCVLTSCIIAECDPNWGDCDGEYYNGCETSINNDINNCGSCGYVCTLDNATSTCNNGQCEILSCDPGWIDENGVHEDGCEFSE